MHFFFNVQYGKNWVYISMRLLLVAAFTTAIFIIEARTITDFASVQDIAIPAGVGLLGALLVGVTALIPALRVYAPMIIMPSDWALVGTYVYYAAYDNPPLLILIPVLVIFSGVLRLGSLLGLIQAAGVIVSVLIALLLVPSVGMDTLLNNPLQYAPLLLFTILAAALSAVWYNSLDEENHINRKLVRKEIEESRTRLENMRERAKAVSEMAMTLNSTLSYEKILDAALDIGRLSIRHDPKERVISMALMVANQDELIIGNSRGIPHIDLNHTFPGKEGIIAEAITEGYPIIDDSGGFDPELKRMSAFTNIKTILCIPLRANYESYGVLVFGSTVPNAINEDHIDTLAAIGTQATIALQNAVLYGNLLEEKERLIRIEENGRKALVRDLHDIPTQTISAVAMQLSIIPLIAERQPEKLKEEIENLRQMALRATEELRHVMFTMRPLALEAQGLSAALQQLSTKMTQTYKQPMEVQIDSRVEQYLDKDAQGTLFYLIEEAANNARKYAQADQIRVRVGLEGSEVVVKVRDNGKGFNTDSVSSNYERRGSFGMVNMRERAELINGEFQLESAPARGTTVTVRVPVDRPTTESNRAALQPRKPLKKQKKQYSGPISPSR